ncbi:hypothetical protein EU528_05595 [Candidatus Thorarchaeota archaeon]|nr:MAG: hypothetical protein EU528_05595 [Candidatus Thorarchaeota archaeon]
MFDAIERRSELRNLLLGILASVIIIAVMSFATQTLVYEVYGEFTMPDTRFGYTFTEIQTAFNAIGIEGLRVWAIAHSPDFLFPLAYTFSMMFGIMLELKRLGRSSGHLRKLVLLPLAAGLADYIENTLILSQIAVFPNLSEIVIIIANLVTLLKWAFLIIGFVVIFALLVVIVINSISSRLSKEEVTPTDSD